MEAAFRRVGVLRVNSIADIFYMTEVLANQPRPKGPKLAIITNAGGPGVIATDALLTLGGELADISTATTEELNKVLPPHWSHNNPIDIIGDAGPERFEAVVEVVAKDPNVQHAYNNWMGALAAKSKILDAFEETGIGIGKSEKGEFFYYQVYAVPAK